MARITRHYDRAVEEGVRRHQAVSAALKDASARLTVGKVSGSAGAAHAQPSTSGDTSPEAATTPLS